MTGKGIRYVFFNKDILLKIIRMHREVYMGM